MYEQDNKITDCLSFSEVMADISHRTQGHFEAKIDVD